MSASPSGPAVGAQTRERWMRRTRAEQASASVMDALAQRFERVVPDAPRLSRALRAAADDERRHATLCLEVVRQLGGDLSLEDVPTPELPPSESGDIGIALVEHVVFLLCAGEAIAAEMLRAAAAQATAPGVGELLTGVARDETGHGRLGWRVLDAVLSHIAPISRDIAAELAPRQAMRAVVAAGQLGEVDEDSAAWGLLSSAQAREIAKSVLRHQVGPSLAERGLWRLA